MAIWPLSDAGLQAMGGAILSTSLMTSVSSGNANVVGSWVMMHSAATFPVSGIVVHLGKTGVASAGLNRQWMFDVGVGATSLETVVVQNVAFGGSLPFASWFFPLNIPFGSRISLRVQSITALSSITMGMWVMGGGQGIESGNKAVTYGAVPASSIGTVLTAPGSANVEGATWTVLSAATTAPIRWIVVGITSPNTSGATAADLLVDIGVGASGAEKEVVTDIPVSVSVNEEVNMPRPLTFPAYIPFGSRLVARYRGTSTLTTASPTVTVTGIG
jgi:hypothetical protein